MDALEKLNEKFLTCNICTGIFKDPCTIDCQHTFCQSCLSKYTETRRDAITAKSILCPNCRQMTKVPRPEEPVDQWCHQFKPSFLIQGLMDTFTSQEASDPIEHCCCFACHQIEKITPAKSVCEDCEIVLCEACTRIHKATPVTSDHVISPLSEESSQQIKKRNVLCKEHNCLVEFCCEDCQKAVCNKCCIIYHRKCHSVVTLDSMIHKMKYVLNENDTNLNLQIQETEDALEVWRYEVEDILQRKSSMKSEIRNVSQQAVDLIRRKEKKLMDELDSLTQKQTEELRGQIKSGEIDLQTYQQYTEYIKQVLQSRSPTDMYDMYTLCQSEEITAGIQRYGRQGERKKMIHFKSQLDVNDLDKTLQLGHLWNNVLTEDKSDLPELPDRGLLSPISTETKSSFQRVPKVLSIINFKTGADKKVRDANDIEVVTVRSMDTLVVIDHNSIKSCYTKDGEPHCATLKLHRSPWTLTKISQDSVAVSYWSRPSIELIELTPDPVQVSTIKTKKTYRCLTALSDTTLAAGCADPPGIDVLDLLGNVLRSVITPSRGQHIMLMPRYMSSTRQGHILIVDAESRSLHCLTQQGLVLYTYKLSEGSGGCGGVTTTDTGSVIVADSFVSKCIELTEIGEYVRDLLTIRDGIDRPKAIRVRNNRMYVSEDQLEQVKIFQM